MQFWKMHGLGNDFIIVDNRGGKIAEAEAGEDAKKLCMRHTSVGADGLLLLSVSSLADVRMQIFNSDGSEAEMCGNGVRCFAKYCYENGIVKKTEFTVDTLAGLNKVWLKLRNDEVESVTVDMGIADWERTKIPMLGAGTCINCDLGVADVDHRVTCLSIGNPHCVMFVDDVDSFPVEKVGTIIENHEVFPNHTNVEFVQICRSDELKVRVWERGCGETLACGTGACASAVAANRLGLADTKVTVCLRGGNLLVELKDHVLMTGPAEKVFEGRTF